ncbi:MAG TPA: hypothetical protein VFE62_02585 [Gemmataceae bacterium]|nr:hypothetical protein [Gemmataceae bacterium]
MLRCIRKTLCWQAIARRLCVAVTLLAYASTALGFPLPAGAASTASPDHGCGQRVCCCGTVEQCKTSGCGCSHDDPEESNEPTCCVKKPTSAKPDLRWVLSISARKCSGGATEWVSAHAALPGAMPLTWQPSWPYCHRVPLTRHCIHVVTSDLLDPPPRSEAA